jgi:hypothetical protein
MNPSEPLLYQAQQFAKTRSFSLNMQLKNELGKIYYDLGHGVLNKNCSTCVRIAMDRLNAELAKQEIPRLVQLEKTKKARIHLSERNENNCTNTMFQSISFG